MKTDVISFSAIALAIVLVISVGIPVVSDLSSDTRTNVGDAYYTALGTGTHTLIVSNVDSNIVVTYDGTAVSLPDLSGNTAIEAGTASAIAYGVYEAANLNDTLRSMAGASPSVGLSQVAMRTASLQGNIDNYSGTYQMMNWYQWQAYRLMSVMLTGTMDTQTVMGSGITSTDSAQTTGQVNSYYSPSTSDNVAISLLIENPYGNTLTLLGDTAFSGQAFLTGRDIGTNDLAYINNTISLSYLSHNSGTGLIDNYGYTITRIEDAPSTWGLPSDLSQFKSGNINDGFVIANKIGSSAAYAVGVGGSYVQTSDSGIFAVNGNITDSAVSDILGTRLAYYVRDSAVLPTVDTSEYVYRFAYTDDGTIGDTEALIDGTWVAKNYDNGINSYWTFDNNGIGMFGAYYAAINVYDGANADDATETRLNKTMGGVGYILNPNDWTKTVAGNSYDANNYNIMLVVPTMYWGTSDGYVYMSNNANAVAGVSMTAYAHTYTVDADVDTLNPTNDKNVPLTLGTAGGILLYGNGNVVAYSADSAQLIGNSSDGVTITIDGTTVTSGAMSLTDQDLSISDSGNKVLCGNPTVIDDSQVAIVTYGTIKDSDGVERDYGHIVSGTIASPVVAIVGYTGDDIIVPTIEITNDDYHPTIVITDTIGEATATQTVSAAIVPVTVDIDDKGILGKVMSIIPIILIMICLVTVGSYAYFRRSRW